MTNADVSAAADLRRDWQRWMRVVAYYARSGWRREALDPEEYGKLHARLMAGCTAAAQAAGDADRALYEALAELVRPWLSTRALAGTDREIMNDLWSRCCLADRRLRGGARTPVSFRDWGGPVLALLAMLGLAAAAYVVDNASSLFGGRVRRLAETTWFALRGTSLNERLGLLAVFALVSLFGLFRYARRR